MRNIYLPNLLSIKISHYSLYLLQPTFKYDFVQGVNLIIGVNGIGKTTFINLIKYALIGGYKKDVDVRVYKDQKKENRIQYPNNYFSNRMSAQYKNNTDARVELEFEINNCYFKVIRSLYNLQLEQVKFKNKKSQETVELIGDRIRQDSYQKLSNDNKEKYLQYNYEQLVAEKSNFYSFDDFIFYINEVLFFGENHKTILWDHDVQERLSNKYFNEISLDEQYETAKRNTKYFNSKARHKSEDIRAIKTMIEKMQSRSDSNDNTNIIDIIRVKDLLEQEEISQLNVQEQRVEIDRKLKELDNKKNLLLLHIKKIELDIEKEENLDFSSVWKKISPDYEIMYKHIESNHSCPLCNELLDESKLHEIIDNSNKCFLCGENIYKSNKSEKSVDLKNERISMYSNLNSIEQQIIDFENELTDLDNEYRKITLKIRKYKSDIRLVEHKANKEAKDGDNTFQKMLDEINQLEMEKNDFQRRSDENRSICNEIVQMIDDQRRETNEQLSIQFSEYAQMFLGTNAYLTYDESNGNDKMYLPVISGNIRKSQEELSESQSFFVDHSFRMSLLNHFYSGPGMFICETPESSLDLSYEENAAETFLKFLKVPNVLILTTNLNNSEFLMQIIEKATVISHLNLLNIGNPSTIQRTSLALVELSNKVEERINDKQ